MHLNFDIQSLKKVKELLKNSQNIVLTTHHNPDGDAIGSVLGFYHSLKSIGISSSVVIPNGFPEFLGWLPGVDVVTKYSHQKDIATATLKNADIIFCLDFNGFRRTETMEKPLAESKAIKVLIDHHPEPESMFDYSFSFTEVSSTAELVFEVLSEMFGSDCVNSDAAECLYVGMMTDTGSFSYACSRERTFAIAGKLVEKGVNVERVQGLVYNNFSAKRMQLLGYCLAEKMKVFPEHNAAYIWLTKDELKKYKHQNGDTEGFVNYPLSIKGVVFSVLFMENDGFIKVSLRSRGTFPVNEFSKRYYNGGGHTNAAGGKSFTSMGEAIAKFEELLVEYSSKLNASK